MTTDSIISIQRGILFLMAEWSGSAKWAHQQLADCLQQHRIPIEHLFCIDIDGEPGIYDLPEFSGRIHGHGEAAMVRDGRIIFVTTLGKDKSLIRERCEELLGHYIA